MKIFPSDPNIDQGDILRDAGAFEQALAVYESVIATTPGSPVAHFKIGTVYARMGRRTEAEASYFKAVRLAPDYPEAANNLALIYAERGEFNDAETLYRNALSERVDYFEAHLNLGDLLKNTSRWEQALYHYQRAVQLQPKSPVAKSQLGEMLFETGRISEAVLVLQKAIELDGTLATAWANLARCHLLQCNYSAAEACGRKAIEIDPKLIAAWQNLLLTANYYAANRSEVFLRHQAFGQHLIKMLGKKEGSKFSNSIEPKRRIRVGFLSGDLRRHSVSYFIEGFLSNLDPKQIEAWAYYNNPTSDQRSEELMPLFAEWRSIWGLSNSIVADIIRSDQIDILFDLAGATGNSRLGVFALKPAPIQVSWIGYPNTTGLETIDYRLTDEFADPAGQSDQFHSETLIRLPNSFLCYTPPKETPPITPSPHVENGYVTFGSFNSLLKISDETLELWRGVMDAVPQGKLLLKSVGGFHDQATKEALLDRMRRLGFDLARVTLLKPEPTLEEHLAMYGKIDICLDTFPYHGTTTTCEALWMGVPVLTLAGDQHAARVGVSLLTNIGLPDFVASNVQDYVRIAAKLATNSARMVSIRSTMRQRMFASPLLDAPAMARNVEQLLRHMWAEYCKAREKDAMLTGPSETANEKRLAVNVRGGHRISVSADVMHNMTSWVMLEQEDWFEDEIGFVRELCSPAWQALDIGANHGVYALTLASSGAKKIWAFEPTSEPRLRLRVSIALNRFEECISVIPVGLSATSMKVSITLSTHSELNSLHVTPKDNGGQETIRLEPLDALMGTAIPGDACIDFVKLDAEGEEVAILRGGLRFFATQSPLVMFELRHGAIVNGDLIATFRSLGYSIYRLIVALNCLVPVGAGKENELDELAINLFACKPDRAAILARSSHLVDAVIAESIPLKSEWLEILLSMPSMVAHSPAEWMSYNFENHYGQALLAWCGSRRTEFSSPERNQLLAQALNHFQAALASEDGHPAVALLGIRICADIGMRVTALNIAGVFLDQMTPEDALPLDRPLPPAYDAFDARPMNTAIDKFLYQSVVEFLLDRGTYSQVFRDSPRWLIQRALNSPERSPRVERTALLSWAKSGRPLVLAPDAKVFCRSEDNRNPALWQHLHMHFAEAPQGKVSKPETVTDKALELQFAGKHVEALRYAESELRNTPQDASLLNVAGAAAKALGDVLLAEQYWRTATTVAPNLASAHFNLAGLFAEQNLFESSKSSYEQAIKADPDFLDAYNNFGNLLIQNQHYSAAESLYRRGMEIQPLSAEINMNLGVVMKVTKQFDSAVKFYRRALEIRPDIGNAVAEAYHCANHICDWDRRAVDEARLAELISDGANDISPFILLSMGNVVDRDPALLQRQAAYQYAQKCYRLDQVIAPVAASKHKTDQRLRIGYLSADFCEHATMQLMRGLLMSHDTDKVKVHAYSYGLTVDPKTKLVAETCEVFRDIRALSDRDAAELIVADGIDILVDLKGYTQDTRLEISALRPAPIIVSWLGYPGTLGHPQLADYIIGDPVVTPPEHAPRYSETLALMPHCYQPNDRDRDIGIKPSKTDAGLPEHGFVFCCFNNSFKLDPDTFDVWCRLLIDIPGSVLWLLTTTAPAESNLRQQAARRGVDERRLIFAPFKPIGAHLGRLQLADLALDTFPYTSHTTASDALWAGVPLITRIGETFASRVAASLLHAVNLPELVTTNLQDYYRVAKALALSPQRLTEIQQNLVNSRRVAPLFDTLHFTRDLERLYNSIWEQHGKNKKDIIILKDK